MVRRKPVRKDNGWVKHLPNGGTIDGLDKLVKDKRVSWSRTPCSDLVRCEFNYDGCHIEINGIGEYWQSDDLEVLRKDNSTVDPYYIVRRLQKKIVPGDRWLTTHRNGPHKLRLNFPGMAPIYTMGDQETIRLNEEHYNKWITIEIDAQKLTTKYYFSDRRI